MMKPTGVCHAVMLDANTTSQKESIDNMKTSTVVIVWVLFLAISIGITIWIAQSDMPMWLKFLLLK